MSQVLDLSVLAPEPKKIKYGDKEFTLYPPKMSSMMTLSLLGEKMADLDSDKMKNMPAEELDALQDKIMLEIIKCVPEMEGAHLSMNQLIAMLNAIIEMGTPPKPETPAGDTITPNQGEGESPKE